MYKITKLTPPETLVGPPHCDSRVLHAPGECEVCDKYPTWQELRFVWGIAFTGYEPDQNELPDPATYVRGEEVNAWEGNKPQPPCEKEEPKPGPYYSPELIAALKANTHLSDSTRAKLGIPWGEERKCCCGCKGHDVVTNQ